MVDEVVLGNVMVDCDDEKKIAKILWRIIRLGNV